MLYRINSILKYFGYAIRRPYSGFSLNYNIDWIKKYNINTILDVGANIGQFAKFIYGVFPNALIYSFEPIEECYDKLKVNMKDSKNFRAFNFALGSKDEEMNFYLNDFTPSSSLLKITDNSIENFPITKNQKISKVSVKKLDGLINDLEIRKNVLMKIDVQGFEKSVLEGSILFIEKFVKLLIVETSIIPLYENESSFEQIYDLITKLGFDYKGNLDQLYSPITGEILQVDAIFMKKKD